jgi:hypothetical protein
MTVQKVVQNRQPSIFDLKNGIFIKKDRLSDLVDKNFPEVTSGMSSGRKISSFISLKTFWIFNA